LGQTGKDGNDKRGGKRLVDEKSVARQMEDGEPYFSWARRSCKAAATKEASDQIR